MSTTTFNGEGYTSIEGEMVVDLVVEYMGHALNDDGTVAGGTCLGITVAVDSVVIPCAKWATTPVTSTIDIVIIVQRG